MTNNYEFPTPTLISGNGVELEVFEAGQKMGGNLSFSATDGQSMPFLGDIK